MLDKDTDLSDLLCSSKAVLLKVISQVQEGASLQVLAVTEDDQETLLLHTDQNDPLPSNLNYIHNVYFTGKVFITFQAASSFLHLNIHFILFLLADLL